jgi:hypothetical protein
MSVQPIFVFSISRSGSTLVQRILAAHEGIATTSEPWLLLPYAYSLRPRGIDAEYYHPLLPGAIEDFSEQLPGGEADYRDEVRACVLRLYEKAAGGAPCFVDKSPPYCLISEEIIELFPEAKFVFLWRNPLSVVASMIDTWGPWHPTFMTGDLFIGLPRLIASYESNRHRAHAVKFEDVVSGAGETWTELMRYLGMEFDPGALDSFAGVDLVGRMGDPTGRRRYRALSTEPQEKWRKTLANPVRREWARRYIRFLGEERLASMGYDRAQLLAELDSERGGSEFLAQDSWRALKGIAKEPIRVRTRNRRVGTPNVLRELLGA